MPTTRGPVRRDTSHPQSSRLSPSSTSYQLDLYSKQHATPALPAYKACQTDGSQLHLQAALQDTDTAAVYSTPSLSHKAAVDPVSSVHGADQADEDADLMLACQQLAEAAASHAQKGAQLQQALCLQSDKASSAQVDITDGTPTGPDSCNHVQNNLSAACNELLRIALASGNQATAALDDAAAGVDDQNACQACLSIACQELAQVASAHGAQRTELHQLIQQRLEESRSIPAAVNHAVDCTADKALNKLGSHGAGHAAAAKGLQGSALGVKPKRLSSAADTAAWPPAPSRCTGAGQGGPSRAGRFETGRGLFKARSNNSHVAVCSKHAVAAGTALTTATFGTAETCTMTLNLDAHTPGTALLLTDTASDGLQLHAADMPRATLQLLDQALAASTLRADADERVHAKGLQSSQPHDPADGADLPTAAAVTDEVVINSQVPVKERLGHDLAAEAAAEPSFGTVHAILSALQLPALGVLQPGGPNPPDPGVLPSHHSHPVMYPGADAAAGASTYEQATGSLSQPLLPLARGAILHSVTCLGTVLFSHGLCHTKP